MSDEGGKPWGVERAVALAGAVTGVLIIVGVLAFYLGRGCAPSPEPIETGIDAGPTDQAIDEAIDAAIQEAQEELDRLEEEHAENISMFNEQQREKYERLQQQGPEEVSRWLIEFNRNLRRRDGGRSPR